MVNVWAIMSQERIQRVSTEQCCQHLVSKLTFKIFGLNTLTSEKVEHANNCIYYRCDDFEHVYGNCM